MDPEEWEGTAVAASAWTCWPSAKRLVFQWCRRRGIPIAFVLAGGYLGPDLGQEELVNLHRLTLEAASRIAPRPR